MRTGKIFWYDPNMYRLWFANSKKNHIMHQQYLLKKGRVTPKEIHTQILSGTFASANPT